MFKIKKQSCFFFLFVFIYSFVWEEASLLPICFMYTMNSDLGRNLPKKPLPKVRRKKKTLKFGGLGDGRPTSPQAI